MPFASVVFGTVLLAATAGCRGQDEPPPPEEAPRLETASSLGRDQLPGYCVVQAYRAELAAGEESLDALPDWVDTTEEDGTPRIIDYTTDPGISSGAVDDRIRELAGESPPASWVTACTATTTDADIVRTQGALGYLAEPGQKTPDPEDSPRVPSLGLDLGAYCYTQYLRELIDDGTISDTSLLPADIDLTVVGKTPRIIDFSTPPRTVLGHYVALDAIVSALRDEVPDVVDGSGASRARSEAIEDCAVSTDDAAVVETQGGPGHLDG